MGRSKSIHEYIIYFRKIKGDKGGPRTCTFFPRFLSL